VVEIVATQSRYTRGAAPSPPAKTAWEVPACVRLASGLSACDVLSAPTDTIRLDTCPACESSRTGSGGGVARSRCSDWFIGNAGGRGYYVTVLPPAVVRKMAGAVKSLEPAERMVVLSDELALVRAARHDVGTLLDFAAGFGAERTTQVVQTLTGVLRAVEETVATAATRPALRRFVAALMAPALEEVGVTGSAADSDEKKALRAALFDLLGGVAREPEVVAAARELVDGELEKPGSVESTLLSAAVELAALGGEPALYDRYLARSRAAADPEERYRYLYALTRFADPALVRRTMELALSPDVRAQDTKLVVAQMLTNLDSQHLAWDLVRQHWNELQKKTGEFVGNTVVVGALGSFCDARTATEIRTFFKAHQVPDAERTLQQALERIGACAQLSSSQGPRLAAWLKNHEQ
jgi:aminopeptidase N